MMFGTGTLLGLALRDRSILVAEVHFTREQSRVRRTGQFVFPAALSLHKPQALGKALRVFLKANHFTAGRSVVGVPARWLMARERDLPPATPATAAGVLRLQAERDFPSELKELVFDYAGQANAKAASKVLLVAMLREQLDQVREMADAAHLALAAVTASTLALARIAGADDHMLLVLASDSSGAELATCGQGVPRLLRHLPMAAGGLAAVSAGGGAAFLGSEVQRAVSALPPLGSGVPASRKVLIWDGSGFDPGATSVLADRAGMPVELVKDLSVLAVRLPGDAGPDVVRYAPAIALALAGARRSGNGGAVEFLKPRLAPPRARRLGRRAVCAAAILAVLVGGFGWLLYDIQRTQSRLDDIHQQMDALSDKVAAAEALAAKTKMAGGWYDARPPVLACLKELTQAFGAEGRIWATSLSLHEDGKGTLTGRAVDSDGVLSVRDRIQHNRKFQDVKIMDIRDVGGSNRDQTFTLSFTFTGVE